MSKSVLIDLRPRKLNKKKLKQIPKHYPGSEIWVILSTVQWEYVKKNGLGISATIYLGDEWRKHFG